MAQCYMVQVHNRKEYDAVMKHNASLKKNSETTKKNTGTSKKSNGTLRDALALTTIIKHNGMTYRLWPDGVGGTADHRLRPALTEAQKTYMWPVDIIKYNEGKQALVPIF